MERYIAVDLETTGLDVKTEQIIEIGAVRVEHGRVVDEFETFVNPYRQLDERIVGLTGITDEDLAGAPGIGEAMEAFLRFAGELPLIGHQILFDYRFLKKAAVNLGIPFERDGIDTLLLARKFMPEAEKKNLGAACQYFHVGMDRAHRALSDAKAAMGLYEAMKKEHFMSNPEAFSVKKLVYKVKKEQPASKRQKERLQYLIKCHRICLTVQIDHLTRNEISRITDKIIAQYGRI